MRTAILLVTASIVLAACGGRSQEGPILYEVRTQSTTTPGVLMQTPAR
jgi:hypothetical protein